MAFQYKNINPFNVEAELIGRLKSLDRERFYNVEQRRTTCDPPDVEQQTQRLFETLPCLRDTARLIVFGVPAEEMELIRSWEHFDSFVHVLCFLRLFSRQMPLAQVLRSPYFYSLTHAQDGRTVEFDQLNTNAEETGVAVYPKIRTIHDPLEPAAEEEKHWAADRVRGVQSELADTYYVELDDLRCAGKRYRVRHSFLSRHIFPEGKKRLKIAVCPVGRADLLAPERYACDGPAGKQRLFRINGLKDEAYIHDRCAAAIVRAAEEGADIVIFPEMLGSERLVGPAFYEETARAVKERGGSMPGLILLPTWWHDNKNALFVLDAAGRWLCVQEKQFPFVYTNDKTEKNKDGDDLAYCEDLREIDRTIHMVHIPDVGRFAFPICRDFLETDYAFLMLQQLRATFLLCPSYTLHKKQFDLTAPGAIPYGCYVLWCNTCAAFYDEAVPAYVGLASGPQELPAGPVDYMRPECGGRCGQQQDACIFLVEISMDHSAVITHRHIYA